MANLSHTEALLERLSKELDGKLKCSAEVRRELDALIAEIQLAHEREVSTSKQQALIPNGLALAGLIVRLTIPEIRHFFGD